MSNCLRYRNPTLCDYLASQYVAGTMTTLVRKRMDTLIRTVPEMEKAVAFWADTMSSIDYQLPEAQVPSKHWQHIEARLAFIQKNQERERQPMPTREKTPQSWWQRLIVWQVSTALCMAMSIVLVCLLVLSPTPDSTLVAPSYMAAMSASEDTSTITFVVNAYKKTQTQPSRLLVQWSERQPRQQTQALHIWTQDKDSGERRYIGREPQDGQPWHLQKAQWQAIANSSQLLVTTNANEPTEANIIFSGPCVPLGDWKASA